MSSNRQFPRAHDQVWVDLDRAIEHATCILQSRAPHLMLDLAAAKIILVGLHVFGWRFLNRALLVLT
jgi:hypothetical protein